MPGKIFVNYRRDDVPGDARGVRDGLAAKFGKSSIFMDVDNLLVGQRFDIELAKALDDCDMLIAVIGPRWLDLLKARSAAGERDYVREEIAEALKRKIAVVPVRVGREGSMPALPRPEELPEDIRELVLYQKHDVAHERFGRDMAELVTSVLTLRKAMSAGKRPGPARAVPLGWIAASMLTTLGAAYAGAYYAGVPVPWPWSPPVQQGPSAAEIAVEKARTESAERERVAAAEIEKERQARTKAEAEAAAVRRELEARQKAEVEAKRKADEAERLRLAALKAEEDRQRAAAEAKRKAEEAERQRLAALKVEEDRQRAAAEAKRKADEEAARRVPQPGQSFRDCTDGCPEMVVVPAGEFTMGSNDYDSEKPPHRVTIRQPFAVGKFEVTFAEWEACVSGGGCNSNRSPSDHGWGKGRRPVINVSWNDAKEYVSWLSRKTGKTYRLLSEAEWEYAARAGTNTRYSWGNDIDCSKASYNGGEKSSCYYNPGGKYRGTQAVGSYGANAFGLHDMHGNVWEWCEDTRQSNYQGAPTDGSAWVVGSSNSRVLRGGSYTGNPNELRSAYRINYHISPGDRYGSTGFRLARTL